MQNADLVVKQVGGNIEVARIYGSGVWSKKVLEVMKGKYAGMVGRGAYQSGMNHLTDPRSLVASYEITTSKDGLRVIQPKAGAKVSQRNTKGNAVTDVATLLDIVSRGWAEPSEHKVFRVAENRSAVTGGQWLTVRKSDPKPFVKDTLTDISTRGFNYSPDIVTKAMNEAMKKGGV